ncbi:MAG: RDD family protein [Rudaea sp.]
MDSTQATPKMPRDGRAPGLYAGRWFRFAAFVIDLIVLTGAMLLSVYVFHARLLDIGLGWFVLACCGVFWLYFSLFESSSQQATPGKRLYGLRVVDERGDRIGFVRASVRVWAHLLLLLLALMVLILAPVIARHFGNQLLALKAMRLIFFACLMMPVVTRREQSLPGWISGSFVVLKSGLRAFHDDDEWAMRQIRPRLPRWVAVLQIIAVCLGLTAWPVYRTYHWDHVYHQVAVAADSVDAVKAYITKYTGTRDALTAANAADNAAVHLPAPTALRNRYVSSMTVANGKLIVTLGEQATDELQGKHLIFRYAPAPEWHCSSPDIPRDMLPPDCL